MSQTEAKPVPIAKRGYVGAVLTGHDRYPSVFDLHSLSKPDEVSLTVYANMKITACREGKLVDVWIGPGEDPNSGEVFALGVTTVRGHC